MRPDASPTGRALLALELIQGSPGITAAGLGRRLGVSERAARRYVGILRETGIPIESVSGPHGGYRAGRGLRLPPLMFSSAEALGLVMAVLDAHRDADDPDDPAASALAKIVRVLPAPVAARAEAVRRTAAVPDRGRSAAERPDPEITAALVDACARHRAVRLDYRSEAGTERLIEVEPWAVVVRHGRWYLLCRSTRADARRAYRVDRVRQVEVLDGTFEPPDGLDPATALEEHLADGWEHAVEVVVDLPVESLAGRLPRTLGRLEPVDATSCRLVGSTRNLTSYVEQLTTIPATYRILAPPQLREAARALAGRLLHAAAEAQPQVRAATPDGAGADTFASR